MKRTMIDEAGKAAIETPTLNMVVSKATNRAWEQQAGAVKDGLLHHVARHHLQQLPPLAWVKANIPEDMQNKSVSGSLRRDILANAINTTGLKLVTSIAEQLKTQTDELKNSLGRKF
jgi:hypothetical protein